jgi:hypothetical protein
MPDRDNYPTDDELVQVYSWNKFDRAGLLEFFELLRSCWNYATDNEGNQWFFRGPMPERDGEGGYTAFYISTGGWSGNESLIQAMQENFILWSLTWYSHRKGGHYEFRLSRES